MRMMNDLRLSVFMIYRTPDMGLSRVDRLMRLDGQPKAQPGTREQDAQLVEFRTKVGESLRSMG